MMRLHDYPLSGNGYKVRLLLAHLARPYDHVMVDILKGESRTAAFLARNPNGRIPVLELDDGTCLAESNAILYWLAQDSPFWPASRLEQAQVLQWLFFEQYSHEPNIATARFWLTIRDRELSELERELLRQKQAAGLAALAVMEQRLRERPFLVGEAFTIADIGLYAYTHVAHEGGFDLAPFAGIREWLARVRRQPGHVSIDHRPV